MADRGDQRKAAHGKVSPGGAPSRVLRRRSYNGGESQKTRAATKALAQESESDMERAALATLVLGLNAEEYPIDTTVGVNGMGHRISLRHLAMSIIESLAPAYAQSLADMWNDDDGRRDDGAQEARPLHRKAYRSEPWEALPFDSIQDKTRALTVVDITRAISTGTAQGTVYSVDVNVPRYAPLRLRSGLADGGGDGNVDMAMDEQESALGRAPKKTVHKVVISRNGMEHTVRAALKKSPICDARQWLERCVAVYLKRLLQGDSMTSEDDAPAVAFDFDLGFVPLRVRQGGHRPRSDQRAKARAWLTGAVDAIAKTYGYTTLRLGMADMNIVQLAAFIANMEAQLAKHFSDPNNDAYIDAIGAYLGSQLAESGISPAFGLLYGTTRVRDYSFYRGSKAERVTTEVGTFDSALPVQATIMQYLDGTVNDLLDNGFFVRGFATTRRGIRRPVIRYGRLASLLCQLTFGLSAAQAVYGICYNDFHMGNAAYESAPWDACLYFRLVDLSRVAAAAANQGQLDDNALCVNGPNATDVYYRVPTYGRVYKVIDAGRATFSLDKYVRRHPNVGFDIAVLDHSKDRLWGSDEADKVFGGDWNLRNPNGDLIRAVSVLASVLRMHDDSWQPAESQHHAKDPDDDGPDEGYAERLMQTVIGMMRHVLSCGPNNEDIFAWSQRCDQVDRMPVEIINDINRRLGRRPSSFIDRCKDYAFLVKPYLDGSSCTNAVPAKNVHWFDSIYKIDPHQVPPDAHVYAVYS